MSLSEASNKSGVTLRGHMENVGKTFRTSYISHMQIMFIEALSLMYPKTCLISIHLNETFFSDETFISAFHSLYLYLFLH